VAASSSLGIFVLVRHTGRIVRFHSTGKTGTTLEARLATPADIAVAGGRLFVGDPGLAAVLALDPAGKVPPQTVMTGVQPISLAVRGGRVAVLDRGRQRIVVRRLGSNSGPPLTSIQLPRVDDDMTLTMDGKAYLTLTQPHQKRVQLFTPRGELLASAGDPCFLDHLMDFGAPVAAHLEAGRLIIVGLTEVKAGRVHIDVEKKR